MDWPYLVGPVGGGPWLGSQGHQDRWACAGGVVGGALLLLYLVVVVVGYNTHEDCGCV